MNRNYSVKELNLIPEEAANKIKEKILRKNLTNKVSLHYVAQQLSTSDKVTVSCGCKNGCYNFKTCSCLKNRIECSVYCHSQGICQNFKKKDTSVIGLILKKRRAEKRQLNEDEEEEEEKQEYIEERRETRALKRRKT